jgi:hypothetical protein
MRDTAISRPALCKLYNGEETLMAAHSKDKSETSASHPRRETRGRTATEKASRAMDDAAPTKHDSEDVSPGREPHSPEASPPPADAHDGIERVREAMAYLRDHEIDDVVRDAVAVVRDNPVVALLVIGGVVLGGAAVVAGLRQGGSHSREVSGMGSAQHILGPKTHETLDRMRQAAFSFALAKVIDSIDHNFPGFREHFEKS